MSIIVLDPFKNVLKPFLGVLSSGPIWPYFQPPLSHLKLFNLGRSMPLTNSLFFNSHKSFKFKWPYLVCHFFTVFNWPFESLFDLFKTMAFSATSSLRSR